MPDRDLRDEVNPFLADRPQQAEREPPTVAGANSRTARQVHHHCWTSGRTGAARDVAGVGPELLVQAAQQVARGRNLQRR
ncbi:hypothetical protein ACBJ59_52460 [Nonomuraea sp. MTCD27]|uniref:hypothetical protein n=1 Tax=Nonomuraea sp. MTCD27 TaxID=1676747 RepID=UPI0035C014FB